MVSLTANADDGRTNAGRQTVTAARYSIDSPSWISGTLTYSMSAVDGAFDQAAETIGAQIDTSGWSFGKHLLFLEGQDSDGFWGAPSAVFLNVFEDGHAVSVSPLSMTSTVMIGQVAIYSITVTNSGVISDVYSVEISGNHWPVDALLRSALDQQPQRPCK
ncbi:MAG: hypothetical protein HC802_20675 [Caldilineaceae bacterium]|nr:hypothetical protein [Caldilineaceae bacterium]